MASLQDAQHFLREHENEYLQLQDKQEIKNVLMLQHELQIKKLNQYVEHRSLDATVQQGCTTEKLAALNQRIEDMDQEYQHDFKIYEQQVIKLQLSPEDLYILERRQKNLYWAQAVLLRSQNKALKAHTKTQEEQLRQKDALIQALQAK